MQSDSISKKLDLSSDGNGQKRNREEIGKVLQMRESSSIRDTSLRQIKSDMHSARNCGMKKKQGKSVNST